MHSTVALQQCTELCTQGVRLARHVCFSNYDTQKPWSGVNGHFYCHSVNPMLTIVGWLEIVALLVIDKCAAQQLK